MLRISDEAISMKPLIEVPCPDCQAIISVCDEQSLLPEVMEQRRAFNDTAWRLHRQDYCRMKRAVRVDP